MSLPVVQHQYSHVSCAEAGQNATLEADGKSVTAVRMRPAEFFARTLAFQVRCKLQAAYLGSGRALPAIILVPEACTKIATEVSKKLVNHVIPGDCMRSSYWHDNHMCLQLCTAICQAVPENYNSKRLLSDGSKLLRNAFGLWDIFLKPDSGHADAINLCWCALMLLC
jgi:hypothetical protein